MNFTVQFLTEKDAEKLKEKQLSDVQYLHLKEPTAKALVMDDGVVHSLWYFDRGRDDELQWYCAKFTLHGAAVYDKVPYTDLYKLVDNAWRKHVNSLIVGE